MTLKLIYSNLFKTASSSISKLMLFNKSYCQFIIAKFEEYAFSELEDLFFWSAIHMNFEN